MSKQNDPLAEMSRMQRLGILRGWHEESVYGRKDTENLYPIPEGESLKLRIPTAKIITNRHLGLEIQSPPVFKLGNEKAQKWLTKLLRLNGFRGAMRAAATSKSWAGDVGILFAYKPSERAILGTSWQIGFIEPETYEVAETYGSGVFKAVDIYSYEDIPNDDTSHLERWWTRTRYTHQQIITWPKIKGIVGTEERPMAEEFDGYRYHKPEDYKEVRNNLGVIPFVIVQNITQSVQKWEGASDYQHLTTIFHRLNLHLDSLEQGEQIRNRLMLALIDAEEVSVQKAAGLTALDIKSREDGTDERQAKLLSTPLLHGAGNPLEFFTTLIDLVMEAAGVAQTGSAKEIFGNEAASSNALKTFYAMQAAVAQHKRENWLGERSDFGLSALVRKLIAASNTVNPTELGLETLDSEDLELSLDWPPMFALSAPEQQTIASVAQQAQQDNLPPEHVAALWAKVLGDNSVATLEDLAKALEEQQKLMQKGLLIPEPPARGILGSGQGDGLLDNGGSATKTKGPQE